MAQIIEITNPLTGLPQQVIQSSYTAQQIDDAVARALPNGAIDAVLSNKAEWDGGFLQTGSILTWAENQTINTHVVTNSAVTGFLYETAWAVDFYLYPSGGWRRLIATDIQLGKSYYCIKNASLPWSTWTPIATATPPQEYDLPLAEGMSAVNPCTYRKNQFSEVSVGGSASGTIAVGTAIATLPSGLRPIKTVERPAVYSVDGAWTGGTVVITTDGIVRAYGQESATRVVFAADFVAAD